MRSFIGQIGMYSLGVLIGIATVGGSLLALSTISAPEIDGGSLATGVGLVAASVLILRSRWHSK